MTTAAPIVGLEGASPSTVAPEEPLSFGEQKEKGTALAALLSAGLCKDCLSPNPGPIGCPQPPRKVAVSEGRCWKGLHPHPAGCLLLCRPGLQLPPMEMAPPFRDNPPTSGVPCSSQLASCTIWEMGQNPSGPPGREPPERLHLLTQLPPSGGGLGSWLPEGLLSSSRTYRAEVGQHMGSLGLCDAKKIKGFGGPLSRFSYWFKSTSRCGALPQSPKPECREEPRLTEEATVPAAWACGSP